MEQGRIHEKATERTFVKAIVVGAGGVTRELLRRLAALWEVTIVENSEQRLSRIQAVDGVRTVLGDGTSRLVLEKAGLADAEAVVAATDNDEVNLEVCRIAKQSGILRIAAVAANIEQLPAYREMGVTAFSPGSLLARRIELSLEPRRITSMAFADGRAEAIEFHVAPDSPVRDKALRELGAAHWVVGAVLRNEQLIIPHGDTILQAGDRVTVVGEGAHFSEIVRTFTAGEARFPLDFGKRIAVVVEQEEDLAGPVSEAASLVRNSAATSLLLVYRDPASLRDEEMAHHIRALLDRVQAVTAGVEVDHRPTPIPPSRALPGLCRSESIGTLVVRRPVGTNFLLRLRRSKAVQLAWRARVPVLVACGTFPYGHILTPARQTRAGEAAGRAAIDLASYAKAKLTGVAVVDPLFLAGAEAPRKAREDIGWLRQEAAMQKVQVHSRISRGNPVRVMLEAGAAADLIVLGIGSEAAFWSRVSIASHVAARSMKSVLLVPVRE
jgi:trk system potassium uptake protein